MSVREVCWGAIPGPWIIRRAADVDGWYSEAVAANRRAFDSFRVDRGQGSYLAAAQAIGPEAVDYVLAAAEKGGKEAQVIADRFRALISEAAA